MSMSTYLEAFKPADAKWQKMKAAWDACTDAGVAPPKDVNDFFEGEPPDPSGVQVAQIFVHAQSEELPSWVKGLDWDMHEGFEVDITKLPKDVTVVRFTNSY